MNTDLKPLSRTNKFSCQQYTDDASLPLSSYVALIGIYSAAFLALHKAAERLEREPEVMKPVDYPLLAIASYKFARIITMSFIAAPLRAPFTKRGKSLAAGEVQDEARGEGMQRAMGSLLTCPFCFSVWSATAFVFAKRFAPSLTRAVSTILAISAAGDVLHLGYRNMRETLA